MGYNGERHEHASGGDGGTELNPELVNQVHVADSGATDIGAEIQRIHDDEASSNGAIFVPPGNYDQNTTVTLTKTGITLYSPTNNYRGTAKIDAQSDITSLIIDGVGASVSGIEWDNGVANTTPGVEIRQKSTAYIPSARGHGSHGVFVNQNDADANINGAEIVVGSTTSNSGDGVRVENTTADPIDINGVILRIIEAYNNSGHGINTLSGNGAIIDVAKANGNSKHGVNIDAPYSIVRVAKTENNTGGSVRLNSAENSLIAGQLSEGAPTEPGFPGQRNEIAWNGMYRPPDHSDTTRPTNSSVPTGAMIWNNTDGLPNYSNGTDWVLPDGTIT